MILILLKILIIFIIIVITCLLLTIDYYIYNKYYVENILQNSMDKILRLFNINIVHFDISKLPKNSNIIVYNHIHLLDMFVLCKVQKDLPSFLISKNFNFFPINLITKITDSLEIDFKKSNNTVSKINNKLKDDSSNIYIAPGKCAVYPEGHYLSKFKTGAFRLNKPVTPLIIKYYNNNGDTFNWQDDESIIELAIRTLMNTRIDLYVEVMDTVEPDDDNVDQFRDKVYSIMENRIKGIILRELF